MRHPTLYYPTRHNVPPSPSQTHSLAPTHPRHQNVPPRILCPLHPHQLPVVLSPERASRLRLLDVRLVDVGAHGRRVRREDLPQARGGLPGEAVALRAGQVVPEAVEASVRTRVGGSGFERKGESLLVCRYALLHVSVTLVLPTIFPSLVAGPVIASPCTRFGSICLHVWIRPSRSCMASLSQSRLAI